LQGKKIVEKDEFGVFYTIKQGSNLLELWRWEADRIKKEANKLGIGLIIRPCSFIVDGLGKLAVIITWYLDHNDCPFHEGERCRIHKKRPLTCKSFPLYGTRTGLGLSSKCPDLIRPPLVEDEEESGELIKNTYPEETVALFKDMDIYKKIFSFIRDMESNGVIKWDMKSEVEMAKTLISDPSSRIDLFDLAIDRGIFSRTQAEDIFTRLDSIEGIKDHLVLNISKDSVEI
jgi:Fe-S-cluster containining protein